MQGVASIQGSRVEEIKMCTIKQTNLSFMQNVWFDLDKVQLHIQNTKQIKTDCKNIHKASSIPT